MRNENLKCWKHLTDCEKGALLLAKYENRKIEVFLRGQWIETSPGYFLEDGKYRVKPEPVIKNVELYGKVGGPFVLTEDWEFLISTHKITYKTKDGEPILNSIKMEKL